MPNRKQTWLMTTGLVVGLWANGAVGEDAPNPLPNTLVFPGLPAPAGNPAPMPTAPASASAKPNVEVTQHLPANLKAGMPAPIEVQVINHGPKPVDQVQVMTYLPAKANVASTTPKVEIKRDVVLWNIGKMFVGEKKSLTIMMQIDDLAGMTELRASSEVVFLTDVTTVTKLDGMSEPKLALSVTSPKSAVVGEPACYVIQISNNGNTPVAGVVLHDKLPNGLSHPFGPNLDNELGVLKPNESRQVRLTVTPTQTGDVENRFMLMADGVSPVEHVTVLNVLPPSQLEVTANAPPTSKIGKPTVQTLTIHNANQAPAQNAQVTASLPKGKRFKEASDGGQYDQEKHAVSWWIGDLQPGQTRQVTLTDVGSEAGEQVTRAVVSTGLSKNEVVWMTPVEGVPALDVSVTDKVDPVQVGQDNVYEIRLRNKGSAPVTNVRTSVLLPGTTEAVAATVDQELVDGQIQFQTFPALLPGQEAVIKLKVKCTGAAEGKVKVTVKSDQFEQPTTIEENTTIF